MMFDLSQKADGIGTTGWNWVKGKSEFVGFDFDSIIGHKAGLQPEEIEQIPASFAQVPLP